MIRIATEQDAEQYCKTNYTLHKFELLTGSKNIVAQTVYQNIGYSEDGEMHLVKRLESIGE